MNLLYSPARLRNFLSSCSPEEFLFCFSFAFFFVSFQVLCRPRFLQLEISFDTCAMTVINLG